MTDSIPAPRAAEPAAEPRLFHLQRDHDVSGVSGTGRVANGVLWPDGTVTLRWTGDRPSTVNWERLADAIAIHGHGGATRLVWATPQPPATEQVVAALQARAEALSVEAETEMRRDLEETAQVWHEAADLARRTARKAARSAQPAAGAPQDGAQPS